jgi:hypothetical protein
MANILSTAGSIDLLQQQNMTSSNAGQPTAGGSTSVTMLRVEYNFIDVEYRYGFSQITDALTFLHVSCRYVHRNVCPSSVYVTRSGSWKLGGLEFIGKGALDSFLVA